MMSYSPRKFNYCQQQAGCVEDHSVTEVALILVIENRLEDIGGDGESLMVETIRRWGMQSSSASARTSRQKRQLQSLGCQPGRS